MIYQVVECGGQYFLVVDFEISGIGVGKGNVVVVYNGYFVYVVVCQYSNFFIVVLGRLEWLV